MMNAEEMALALESLNNTLERASKTLAQISNELMEDQKKTSESHKLLDELKVPQGPVREGYQFISERLKLLAEEVRTLRARPVSTTEPPLEKETLGFLVRDAFDRYANAEDFPSDNFRHWKTYGKFRRRSQAVVFTEREPARQVAKILGGKVVRLVRKVPA